MNTRAILVLFSLAAIEAASAPVSGACQAAHWSGFNANSHFLESEVPAPNQGNNQLQSTKRLRKRGRKVSPVQVFQGTIEWEYKPLSWDCDAPNCDHFALYDPITGHNYELDDPGVAGNYEGKRVKITGIEDLKNEVIHVLSIEESKYGSS